MTGDLQNATCYYTILGPKDSDRRLARNALNSARGCQRHRPGNPHRLLPRIKFAYDDEEDRRQQMHDLINEARASDPNED